MIKAVSSLVVVVLVVGCGGAEPSEPGSALNRLSGEGAGIEVPLMIYGRLYQPDEVARLFAGSVYSLLVDEEAVQQGFAYGFLSEDDRIRFTTDWLAAHPRDDLEANSGGDSIFYDHYDGGGEQYVVPEHTAVADLRSVNCFLWWCQNWNNRISSMTPSRVNRLTTLHEYINWGDPRIDFAYTVSVVPNLGAYGFDNAASSISFTW